MWYKVNKRYIGINIVRPNKYEYSYDFRNKTAATLTNDWWTVPSSYWTTSNYSYTNWNNTSYTTRCWKSIDTWLSNIKKISLTIWWYNLISWNSSDLFLNLWDTSDNRWIWLYTGSVNNDMSYNLWWTGTTKTASQMSWAWEVMAEVDLVNLTYVVKYKWETKGSWSLTETQATNIKNRTTILSWIAWANWASWIQYIKLLVE